MVDKISRIAADNLRTERTGKITLSEDETYYVFKLPKKSYVTHIGLEILTAADAGDLTVGFVGNGESADDEYFMDEVATAVTAAGVKFSTIPKWFVDAGGAITLTLSGGGSTAPVVRAFVQFAVIH